MLSGKEIQRRLGTDIKIEPFSEKQMNPNSYNLRLGKRLLVYDTDELDMKKVNSYHEIMIPDEGFVLQPGKVYLGQTMEWTETKNLVPMLSGRSSIGRLGISVHATAGFGDVGFKGYWTLELFVCQPVRVYAGSEICQIYYNELTGDFDEYRGKYYGNDGVQASRLYKDFLPAPESGVKDDYAVKIFDLTDASRSASYAPSIINQDVKDYVQAEKRRLSCHVTSMSHFKQPAVIPHLAIIQVGNNPASDSYIKGKIKDADEIGVEITHYLLPESADTMEVQWQVRSLNRNAAVHGIIVQFPLPDHIDAEKVMNEIYPVKDVDGFRHDSRYHPCTPAGVVGFLEGYARYDFNGKHAVVIGRGQVGIPLAKMLTLHDATVTLCHSKTPETTLKNLLRNADIIFTCVNKPECFSDVEMFRSITADIIDIGLEYGTDGKLHGNLSENIKQMLLRSNKASRIIISGIGGIGLLTRLQLMTNVVEAAEYQSRKRE